jgi:hypothetical protein
LEADNAVRACLLRFHLFDGHKVDLGLRTIFFTKPVINLDHLSQAAFAVMQYDHVGQKQGERLFSRDIPGAPNRMPKAERLLLPCKTRRSGERQMNFEITRIGDRNDPR